MAEKRYLIRGGDHACISLKARSRPGIADINLDQAVAQRQAVNTIFPTLRPSSMR